MIHRWRMRTSLRGLHEDELPRRERERLLGHLARCGECRAALRTLVESERLLGAARPEPARLAPAAAEALLRRALAESQRHPQPSRTQLYGTCGALAAAAIVALAVLRARPGPARPDLLVAPPAPHVRNSPPIEKQAPRPQRRLVHQPEPFRTEGARRNARRIRQPFVAPRVAGREGNSNGGIAAEAVVEPAAPALARYRWTTAPPGPRASLFVGVSTRQPPPAVSVREAAAESPGFARVTALRPDGFGRRFLARATVSSERPGSEVVLRPLPGGAARVR